MSAAQDPRLKVALDPLGNRIPEDWHEHWESWEGEVRERFPRAVPIPASSPRDSTSSRPSVTSPGLQGLVVVVVICPPYICCPLPACF